MESPVGRDQALRERVLAVQADQLYQRNLFPALLGIPFGATVVWAFWRLHAPLVPLLWWFALKVVTASVRIGLGWLYARRGATATRERWIRRYVIALGIDAVAWTVLAIAFGDHDNLLVAGLAIGILIAVASIGNAVLSTLFASSGTFLGIMLVPAAIYHLAWGDTLGLFVGGALMLLLGIILTDARHAARDHADLLRLRFEIADVARERAEALELARRHSAAKSQFLATVSHEMRTPLHGILGTVRMLRDGVTAPRELSHVGTIERSGDHLLGVINDVLDFSRIEAGGLQIRDEPYDLAHTLDDAAAMLAATAVERSLHLESLSSLPRPSWVRGDGARVRQILLNLLGNAVKFTERGEVRLTARRSEARPGEGGEGGARVLIEVTDTGHGIPEAEQAAIFEAFRQADSSYSRRYGGTGLGLTISRELARAMGGDLRCTSKVGVGSVFTLELPWRPAEAPVEQIDHEPGELPRLRGRVLLAEDNAVNVMVARAALEQMGLTVVVASDGEVALERWRGERPDVVLMDCHMPRVDGFEASRRIREEERSTGRRSVAIIAATASASTEQRERCAAAGMNELLAKPFSREQLGAVLARYLPAAEERGASDEEQRPGVVSFTKASSVVPAATVAAAAAATAVGGVASLPAVPAIAAAPAVAAAPSTHAIDGREEALDRLAGDLGFYLELLAQFAANQASAVIDIRARVAEGRRHEAMRRAHTLAGLAATIGAGGLHEVAFTLETRLRAPDASTPDPVQLAAEAPPGALPPVAFEALLLDVEHELGRVLGEVATLRSEAGSTARATPAKA